LLSCPVIVFWTTFANSVCSSPTMARCSAAKATGDPRTNFMAPGIEDEKPMGQIAYGA